MCPEGIPGGAGRALAGLTARLPDLGFDPRAVVLQEGPVVEWLERAGCRTTLLRAGRTRQLHRTALVLAQLRAFARREQVRIVVSNESKGHIYGGLAALATRLPAVWWQHEVPAASRIERTASAVPSAAVVCGSSAAVAAQKQLTPWRRVERVYPGVDVDAIRARSGAGKALRRERSWEGPVVGIVGRLQPWKGQDVFLRAAAAIAAATPSARFAVVGGAKPGRDEEYATGLRSLADELGIAEKVDFAGHQDDVIPWFDSLDVVVHASFGEPFGLVLIEAMALGKPLVAAAEGGPLEIVEDGVSGLLVPPGEPERLAAAVLRVLRDPSLAAALSAQSRARAEHFSDERMAASFAELLRDILSHPRGGYVAPTLSAVE